MSCGNTFTLFCTEKKNSLIKGSYVIGQGISVFCTFAGTLFALYDYRHPETRKPENASDYILNFGISTLAAIIAAYTANKFQGSKIGCADDHPTPPKYSYELAPRTWKSNIVETSYLIFATTLLAANNYFLLAAIKAAATTYKNSGQNYPLLPLSTIGFICFIFQTVGVDLIFNATNAFYETAEEIKKTIKGSKTKPLISRILYPLAKNYCYQFTNFWIKTAGVFSHVSADYLGLLLSIPPAAFIGFHNKLPALFWTVIVIGGALSIPLLAVNYLQTLYFEAKESEMNLKSLRMEYLHHHYIGFTMNKKKQGFLRSLLTRIPCLKNPIRYGFFTQGPLHAAGDTMPVILFMMDIFDRLAINSGFKVTAIVLAASFVFISSTLGTHESEVKTAIHHFDEDFAHIGEPTGHLSCN